MAMHMDWLEIEKGVIELIFTRLTNLIDFIHFGAVCKTWRFIFLENRHCLPQLRFLIIPDDERIVFQDFFSLLNKQSYRLKKLPKVYNGKWCMGSSEGCLIMLDLHLNVSLLNPLLRTETPLPRLTTLSNIINISRTDTGTIEYSRLWPQHVSTTTFNPKFYVHKAAMAGPYVVAILGYGCGLVYCRRDGCKWTYMENDWFEFHFEDLVCYNSNIYAVDQSGLVVVVDMSGRRLAVTKVSIAIGSGIKHCRKYLVESFGELLMVVRRSRSVYPYIATGFEIFRVDVNKHQCFPLKSLGDDMLYLGESCSLSLSARDISGFERNCIYFVDEQEWLIIDPFKSCDLHVYKVEDGSIDLHYKRDWNRLPPWPIWITHKA